MFSVEVEVFAVPFTIDAFSGATTRPGEIRPGERLFATTDHLVGFEHAWATGTIGTGE